MTQNETRCCVGLARGHGHPDAGSSADALLPTGIVAAAAVSLGVLLMILRRRRTV